MIRDIKSWVQIRSAPFKKKKEKKRNSGIFQWMTLSLTCILCQLVGEVVVNTQYIAHLFVFTESLRSRCSCKARLAVQNILILDVDAASWGCNTFLALVTAGDLVRDDDLGPSQRSWDIHRDWELSHLSAWVGGKNSTEGCRRCPPPSIIPQLVAS